MVNVPGAFGLYDGFGRTWIDNGDGTYTLRVSNTGSTPTGVGSQSIAYPVTVTGVLSASLAYPIGATVTGSQSVFIVGQSDHLSVSLAYPTTLNQPVAVIGSNFGIRPLRSDSDSINFAAIAGNPVSVSGGTTDNGTQRVAIASDQSLPVFPTGSASWTVALPQASYDPNGHLVVTTDTYTQKIDYDSGNNPIYVGWALPGTSQSTSSWRIEQIVYSSSTGQLNPVDVKWADGNPLFDQPWTSRTSKSYF